MSIFDRFRTQKPTHGPEDDAPRQLHTADFAHITSLADHGIELTRAEQVAGADLASGAIDATGIAAGEGPLLNDETVDARLARALAGNKVDEDKAQVISASNMRDAELGLLTVRPGEEPLSLTGTVAALKEAEAEKVSADEGATETAGVLTGAHPDKEGARWPGRQIFVRAFDFARARLLYRIAECVPLGLALILELIVTSSNLYAAFRLENPFVANALAAAILLSLTVGPHLVALELAERRALGHFRRFGILVVALGSGFWLATGVSLAVLRAIVEASERAARAADESTDSGFAARNGSIPAPMQEAAANAAGSVPFEIELALWLSVLLGVGVVVFMWELHHHNPARIVDLNARERAHWAALAVTNLRERISLIKAELAFQAEAAALIRPSYVIRADALVAECDETKSTYRAELARVSRDPSMINALQLRAREASTSTTGGGADR
ncbi:hypothetical protein C5C74_09525 [Rathayibacter sp. AY1E8]|uniref:hypothetical protein n=1 Tax=Rathayibacter sp. AY1E8 TaxID=2080555 RepID=UPI000CE876B3|nr:hypothetical protein [Rathayibacter sp. AY1E8]PPG17970.1 hypothetical protein C5C74_09525 [Rathayibacter sp. AY1E8]